MKRITLVLFFCALAIVSLSQQAQFSQLDKYFEILEENDKFMGSVSIFKEGVEIYSKAVGYSDVKEKKEAKLETKYKIGSISKTFTAVLVFQAIEDNLLTLETTLNKYFPSIKNSNTITIAQMLSHRSGITTYTGVDFPSWSVEEKTREDMVNMIIKAGSSFTPNSGAQYSNSNYLLLSYILEDIYNKKYSVILNNNIVKPLGLKNSILPKESNSYFSYKYFDKWRIEPDSHYSTSLGAGAIISTPSDLNKFFDAIFNGKLISESSLKEMKTIKDNFGIGLFNIPFHGRMAYGHTGGIDGFNSISAYFPEDRISYSLTSNGVDYVINDITVAVLSSIYNMPFDIPNFELAGTLSEKDLDKYLGVYSTAQLPIKITISKKGNTLVGQGTGQPSFNFAATTRDTFEFSQGGIVVIFNPEKNAMTLKQGGGVFYMYKE